MQRLHSQIRGYPWGSRDFIAKVQGRPHPTPAPEAELWIGAHPDSPSAVEGGGTLDQLIATTPEASLGADSIAAFGARLPYLMKLLAAQEPLSLQAHPDSEQARAGFAAAHPSYVDAYHKPELMLALEDFEALCGFRPGPESAQLLRALGIASLAPVVESLEAGDLRAAVSTLLGWPAGEREALVAAVAQGDQLAGQLAGYYPDDMGVIVALLLNHVTLRPGEAIWMPAGTLHAYVRGAGVEIMASSDNVLRGGLTRKHIDVAELLRVLRFEPMRIPLLSEQTVSPGVVTWPVPVADFRLSRIRLDGEQPALELTPHGPRTVLCLRGEVSVADKRGAVWLTGGESAFGPADGGPMIFDGAGEIYLASL
ncbi:putative mannose-6-phosphate isomerase ManA [Rhizocola hellebori]|uniref:mannose-6-phosphate isomerase n=1 Tax=Rhizocola hellebori TaxID=1392758 RepID=A0A8J3QBV5_9ACTN|nr:mannose-6-phosphate isomerase, class I [Rhizocola hellebori]GIH07052.1 putative mannose-6-phosphate isomerase ManA [Rhizocola hellebori]